MEEKKLNLNPHFISLVMMLSSAAWQQLGKAPNPVTGRVEREVASAQVTIDLLLMLKEKTRGNLKAEEEKLLGNVISDLQLNYADEVNKPEDKPRVN